MKNIGSARIYDKETDKHKCRQYVYIRAADAEKSNNDAILYVKRYNFIRLDLKKYKVEMV